MKSTSQSGIGRHVTMVSKAGREIPLKANRYSAIGPDDRVYIDPRNASRVSIVSTENPDDLITVLPHFERRETLRLGTIDYPILLKELTSQEDSDHYEYLEGFHYKTSTAIVSEESDGSRNRGGIGGRKAVVLAYVQLGKRLVPAGYIELHMPLLMVKPRHTLFANGFRHPLRPIAWETWDVASMRKYVNAIVRIARVVTSPEMRGLGLSRVLVNTAKEYAKERWHVNGRRPLFMEISAEMLKYMDFATNAGLHFVGNTEGNLARIHSDLVQMLKGQKVSFGMMTLQKKYLTQIQSIADQLGRPLPDVLGRLHELTSGKTDVELNDELKSLQPAEWHLFKKVLRFPIPYFMCGLDEASDRFVAAHAKLPPRKETRAPTLKMARISLRDITVRSTYTVADSPHARAIRDCFGLDGDMFHISLVGPVTIEASGGNIILITGASGSGKSLLLSTLDKSRSIEGLSVTYRDPYGRPFEAQWMRDIESDKPLIEYLSERWGIDESISALNQAGLSEAFAYLRPYRLLSRGQQYRARLAELSLGAAPVWLMDEFCADLDPFTARIVATNVRKHVIRTSRIAVIAAANNLHYIDALRPTQVIYLRHNGESEALSYKEYLDEFCSGRS